LVKWENDKLAGELHWMFVTDLALVDKSHLEFKAGDRVVFTGTNTSAWHGRAGTVTEVNRERGHYCIRVKFDNAPYQRQWVSPDELTLQPAPKFAIGDRVVVTGPDGTHYVGLTGTVAQAVSATSKRVPVELDDRGGQFFFQRENVRHIEHLPGHVSNHRCTMDPDMQYVARRELPTEHAVPTETLPWLKKATVHVTADTQGLRKALDDIVKKMDAEVKKQLAEQVVDAGAEACELQKRVEETLAENNRLDADCDKLRDELAKLTAERDALHSERAKVIVENRRHIDIADKWYARCQEVLKERDAARVEADKLRGENKRLDQECNRWQGRYHEAQSERVKLVEKHEAECALLADHMRELHAENDKLKEEAKTDEEHIVRLTIRRKDLEADNSKLSDQANDLAEVLRKIVRGEPNLQMEVLHCRLMSAETLERAAELIGEAIVRPLP
jgi:regulator of replication initiation timing